MFPYTIQQLAQITEGKLHGNPSAKIEKIWTDSRHIVQPKNGIFIALKGAQLDGHNFIESAYKKGIRNFIVNHLPKSPLENANYILVEDPLRALQSWAKFHRAQFTYPVVGITGSNGKTIVKEWLHQLLFEKLKMVKSPKSFNSQLGVPLSVLEMKKDADLAIFELGISQPNEMKFIAEIAKPDIAVITNVGTAHSAFFKDRKEHILEKIKLFESAKTIIFPYDDEELRIEIQKKYADRKLISFGQNKNANIWLTSKLNKPNFKVSYNAKNYNFTTPSADKASILNALTCFSVLTQLEVDLEKIQPEFHHLHAIEMRLEIKKGNQNTIIINDAFNSDLSSIPIALNVLDQQTKERKTLIITDVLQNQNQGEELYNELANWVNSYPIQKVILIGNEISLFKRKFNHFFASYPTTEAFLSQNKVSDFKDEAILLKGARKFKLEKISKQFEEQSHDTILEVNLRHLVENVNYFRSKLKPNTKLMCMVKAFGYGTGGFEVAQALENHNVDYLGVAYADEGADLRKKGITTPIMVMNPEQSSYDTIIEHHLEAEIYSFRVLEKFTLKLIEKKIQKAYPVHIKLNTGMNRLGFKPNEISRLTQELADNPYIKVQSIFSHLATSDMPKESGFVHQQYAKYQEMYKKLTFNLGYKPTQHILNSEGILNYPDYQMDMVRLGIGMYGIAQNTTDKKHLKNVATFKTVISQINILENGETVSYGRRFKAEKTTQIATLPVGYADGVKRCLSNGVGEVLVNGTLAKIVGSVCMDMIMVDVSNIECKEGDEVIIFGTNPTLEQVAEKCNTITYEILTSISSRVKRIYVK